MDKYKKQRVSLSSPLYIYFLYVFSFFFFFILAAALFFRSFVHVHGLAFVLPGETILTLVFSHLLQLCVCSFIIFYPFKREKLFDEHYAPVQFCGVGMMDFGKRGGGGQRWKQPMVNWLRTGLQMCDSSRGPTILFKGSSLVFLKLIKSIILFALFGLENR